MKSDPLTRREQEVLGLIRKFQGASGSALMWAYYGGKFDSNGLAVGSVTITAAQAVVGAKIGTRASELASGDQSVVEAREGATLRASSHKRGYWARSGSYAAYRPDGDVAVSVGVAVADKPKLAGAAAMAASRTDMGLDD